MDMIVKCKDQQKCPLQGESSLSNGGEGLGRGALSGWAGPRPPAGAGEGRWGERSRAWKPGPCPRGFPRVGTPETKTKGDWKTQRKAGSGPPSHAH